MTPDFRTLVLLTLALTASTLPVLDRLPLWLPPLLLLVASWRLWLAWHGHPTPRKIPRTAGALGVFILLVATRSVGTGIDGAAPLFVTFLWLKLVEMDRRRDLEITVFFAFFLVAGGVLTGQSLLQVLGATLAIAFLLTTLVWHQSDHLRTLPLTAGALWAGRQVGGLLLLALPLTLVLFLVCPRPAAQLPPIPGQDARSGVSGILDPGRFARNLKDDSMAFRVSFPEASIPPVDDLYWRGLVLWNTDGNQWKRGISSPMTSPQIRLTTDPDVAAVSPGKSPTTQDLLLEITLLHHSNLWIYTLDCPTTLVDEAMLCAGMIQQFSKGPIGAITYRLIGRPDARDAYISPRIEEWSRQLPEELDPRIVALARSFTAPTQDGQPPDNTLIIDRAVAWFAQSGFLYTTEPGAMAGPATATFLFEQRRGFCAHYASAFTVLMRAAGVPARVVVGYHGGEPNPVGGFLTIRQSHAHAWAEVWTDQAAKGWRRVDLTGLVPTTDPQTGQPTNAATAATSPEVRNAADAKKPWYARSYSRIRLSWEYLEYRWDVWGVGFSGDMQEALFAWLGLAKFGSWAWVLALIGGITGAVGLGVGGTIGWRAWRDHRRLSPAQRWRLRYEKRLTALGVPAQVGEGPLDHARRAALIRPDLATAIMAANEAWIAVRYAPTLGDGAVALRSLAGAVVELERLGN